MSDVVLVTETERRIDVALNRPEARNAINREMVQALHATCELAERDPRVLVLRGGPGIFAAGADICELRERGHLDALAGINSGLFDRIARLPLPTVAVVDGAAIGGGAELAYACDFRIGTARTRFSNPEPSLGIVAAAGACWRLAELVGEPLAKDILLAGRTLSAEEALHAQLLTRLVTEDKVLDDEIDTFLRHMLAMAPTALRLTKLALRAPREAHPTIDNVVQAVLFETEEKRERMTKFLDRSGRPS